MCREERQGRIRHAWDGGAEATGCMQSQVMSQPRQVVMGYEYPRHCQQLVSLTAALQAYPVWVPYGILTSGIFAAPELRAS